VISLKNRKNSRGERRESQQRQTTGQDQLMLHCRNNKEILNVMHHGWQ
jgi:hypothetical protein